MGSVLVVDDERSMREFLGICLKREGHQVSVAESGQQALDSLESSPVDIVVTDMQMPGGVDGLGLLTAIKQTWPDIEVIVVTAYATTDTAIRAMKVGAYDYLTKPFKIDEINSVISRALEKRALVEENVSLRMQVSGRYRLASMLSKSPRMHQVFDLIGKIHSTRTSVLLTGESGTGKELAARALHTEGSRAEFPFVAVNCGAIPEALLESELFGHIKGAFTGAVADKIGLFQQASCGTLFLDEIGEMPLGLQVKLLRALQERKVKPVGDANEIDVDVRVVAATNRELEAEVARGAFRQDLYYRLNVIEVRLPPLRQRREDLPMLVEHFIKRFGTEQRKTLTGITPEAMRTIEAYDYPGNVRELENIIEHATALASESRIDVGDLPRLRQPPVMGAHEGAAVEIPAEGIDLDRVTADFERAILVRALEQAHGVRKRAARLLGISFRSLRYRLQKLGLDTSAEGERASGE